MSAAICWMYELRLNPGIPKNKMGTFDDRTKVPCPREPVPIQAG
jgi:hypothetical protein